MNALELAAARSRWAGVSVGEKATLLLGAACCVIALPPLPALPLFAVLIVVCAVRAGVPWRLYAGLVAAPAAFIAVGLGPLIFAITTNGVVLIPGGVGDAVEVLLRSVVAMSATMLFALTTPMAHVMDWCGRIGVPGSIVHVMALTYRMIATLIDTARTMWEAQALRLGHTNVRRWIHSVAGLIAALFVVAFTRARRLGEGVSLRGELATMHLVGGSRGAATRWGYVVGYAALLATIALLSLFASTQGVGG
ncbi:cobalt ECF transporter T component CbiQ [Corynebacterium sp.]|uniref:cobalt ECF transporter T component CbiQ n=1 Tax=Corynebacterium sp. TaxID=1720 RepID=UPI0026DB911C|nr:cobalt ECF transporter T component CbiQ [Corynebacterium sp.]MDO5076099.1 cobalt ECF transporter T component CbiQ [Corynebacterium sp.]